MQFDISKNMKDELTDWKNTVLKELHKI